MKIDVHAHLFSLAYIQSLQRIFGNDSTPVGQDAQRLIRWMNSDPRMIDVEGRLEEMTKWDIDMQVLSVPFHGALVQDQAATRRVSWASRYRADRMSDFRFPRGLVSDK